MKKQTTHNTTKKTVTKTKKATGTFAVGTRAGQIFAQVPYTSLDFKNSLLIVSLSINVFIFTLWLTTQVSNAYAFHVARYILNS
jgi:hypothetical protein